MEIDWQVVPLSEWKADAVILFLFEKEGLPPEIEGRMESCGLQLANSLAFRDFQAKPQQILVHYAPAGSPIPRAVLAGLGKREKFDMDSLRAAATAALRKCRELQIEAPGLPLAALEGLPADAEAALMELLTSGLTGLYSYDAWKTRDVEPPTHPAKLLIMTENEPSPRLREAAECAAHHAAGVFLTRDLVAAPGNGATPSDMLAAARKLAERHGFRIEVIDREAADALGMGAFTAVARGSDEPAYVIVLEHAPPGTEGEAPLVLVGKGITFDTGGISLKPGLHMEAMKEDMAGAAAVLGVFEIIGRTKLARRVAAVLPCTENMPGGRAYKPGDILRTLSGLTVEVISTDAEGRLILCDAIAYALRMKPAVIVDIATLTGACIVALGNRTTAVLGNNEKLSRSLIDIGAELGDRIWPLPLWDFYFDHLKSDVADFKNVGERTAGTIVASMFLKQFVPDEIPWAHLDIAGTAWADKDLPGTPKGPTGAGVRLLAEFVRRWPGLGIPE